MLRAHYEQFGPVSEVLLSNDHEKAPDANFSARVRPSGIAIIVMQYPEGAAAAVAAGEDQEVAGVLIRIRKFHRRASNPDIADNGVEGDADEKEFK
mmetsp:Transcript_33896/g.59345  ORF Transcript_33896/g.59345 Transcript_33896/m.59345 type:complete len:96 (+) Transcript_33896:405-692(+)